MQRLTQKTFTSSGTWVAPAGVSVVFAQGCGGGGGGDHGTTGTRAYGGMPAFFHCVALSVIPNTTYTVTIGAGGTGGSYSGGMLGAGVLPTSGGATVLGSVLTLKGGTDSLFQTQTGPSGAGFLQAYLSKANNGVGVLATDARRQLGNRGTMGTDTGSDYGGLGGGGSIGAGGNGGNGGTGGTATSGSSAAANTGAGGGAGGEDTSTAGNGGNGGSGILTLWWVE